ncbi:hypothetical protein [Streptomyces liangshanensis]|uniref:Uncharacterized protein n=1 Tax=Streptomyces liangshanensis TaxID=2717324 RepID=A0A6G9GTG4_9ACTN|nr:hypothetical protein [Streptomyces liangshanensis]QIQ01552.1 hypothetical protein HA039_03915 [Streptomyces liangshanensis]
MNALGDASTHRIVMGFLAVLAADTQDQFAWLGGTHLATEAFVEEVEFACAVSDGLAERGVLEPGHLPTLRAIGRRVGEIDPDRHADPLADALATDPAWDDVRRLARQLLVAELGDWRQPLPRRARDI